MNKTIFDRIAQFMSRLSTFGPVVTGGAIPRDATPISEKDDTTEPDMAPQDGDAPAGGGTADGGETTEGDGEKPSGSGGTEDGADTSAEPSSDAGTSEGATEAESGAVLAMASAVRAAVDAIVASPDTEAPGKMAVKFKPTITPAMMKAYEEGVEKGNAAEALSDLIGAALSEALEIYDEKRVLPVEMTVTEAKRVAKNNERINVWAKENPAQASDPNLWAAMTSVYAEYAEKFGQRRADRITMEQLAILATGVTKGGKGKASADAVAQKAASLGSAKTPGQIATIRPKAAAAAKPKTAVDGSGYRDHLKSQSRNLW